MSKRVNSRRMARVSKWLRESSPDPSESRQDRSRSPAPLPADFARGRPPGGTSMGSGEPDFNALFDMGTDGGTGAAGGVSGSPIPISLPQFTRKQDIYTLKFSGTTWVESSVANTRHNNWHNMPWEFCRMFMAPDNIRELHSKYLWWKATNIQIQIKNPVCVQNIGTTTSGLVQTGQNNQAQLFGYLDDTYLTGVTTKPGPTGSAQTTATFLGDLGHSFGGHGYNSTTNVPQFLPSADIDQDLFDHATPDVKTCGMGGGAAMEFGWNITSPYWRDTGELLWAAWNTTTPLVCSAWDERLGTTRDIMPVGSVNASTATQFYGPGLFARAGAAAAPIAQAVNPDSWNPLPTTIVVADGDPIPKLWLQLQPQLNSVETGTAESVVQIQFEMSVTLLCTGRVPRRINTAGGGIAYLNTNMSIPQYGVGRQAVNTLPIYKPCGTDYITAATLVRDAEEEKEPEPTF